MYASVCLSPRTFTILPVLFYRFVYTLKKNYCVEKQTLPFHVFLLFCVLTTHDSCQSVCMFIFTQLLHPTYEFVLLLLSSLMLNFPYCRFIFYFWKNIYIISDWLLRLFWTVLMSNISGSYQIIYYTIAFQMTSMGLWNVNQKHILNLSFLFLDNARVKHFISISNKSFENMSFNVAVGLMEGFEKYSMKL